MINLNKLKLKKLECSKKSLKTRVVTSAGFTLFVAMIVSSLLLAVGFSIGNIILKQLLLAGSGKDSQVAFYAADSGAECVQFWDTKDSAGTPVFESPFSASSTLGAVAVVKCGIAASSTKTISGDSLTSNSTVIIDLSSNTNGENYKSCALVKIEKGSTRTDIGAGVFQDIPYTKITSRGYNSPILSDKSGCDTSNPRTVERGLLIQY